MIIRISRILPAVVFALALAIGGCKKKDDPAPTPNPTPNPPASGNYVLVISTGAQAVEVGKSISYNAYLVSSTGATVAPASVSWSSDVGAMTGNVFTHATATVGVVTASATHDGVTYTAKVPVNVLPSKNSQMFGVVPSALVWSTNGGDVPLLPVYMGNKTASFTYESGNTGIVTVSSTGNLSFLSAGSTFVKVKGNIGGQESEVIVPVMVIGPPAVPLPVTRVVVTPAVGEMFRGEKLQLQAKAFNSAGEDVSSTVTFAWMAEQREESDFETQMPVSVSASGEVSALTVGGAYIKVTANGIIGQSEVIVNPDTAIMVTPFHTQLGGLDMTTMPPTPGPDEVTLTAAMFKIDRAKYRAKDPSFMESIPNPSNLQWDLPLTGIPEIDDQFKVVTLSDKTTTSVKVTRIQGKVGSTVVVAHSGVYGGAASIMVMP